MADGRLRTRSETRTWLLLIVILSSRFMYMAVEILFYKSKVTSFYGRTLVFSDIV